jgi:hypothetical protein
LIIKLCRQQQNFQYLNSTLFTQFIIIDHSFLQRHNLFFQIFHRLNFIQKFFLLSTKLLITLNSFFLALNLPNNLRSQTFYDDWFIKREIFLSSMRNIFGGWCFHVCIKNSRWCVRSSDRRRLCCGTFRWWENSLSKQPKKMKTQNSSSTESK